MIHDDIVEEDNNKSNSHPQDDTSPPPYGLQHNYSHIDFIQGATFLTHMAAVAQMNDHFPLSMQLGRRLHPKTKTWIVTTTVTCRTVVLQGLSQHDFMLAALMDVEAERPDTKRLIITMEEGEE